MKPVLLSFLASTVIFGSACTTDDITISFDHGTAAVEQAATDSVKVNVDGSRVSIESAYKAHTISVRLTGKCDDGSVVIKTEGKAKLVLDGLDLTNQSGAPLWLKNKKKATIIALKGTENSLTIAGCRDTVTDKSAALFSKDKVLLSGKGTLNILATGDGCRGIRTKGDLTIEDLTLNVTTTGNHLGEDTTKVMGFGAPPGGPHPDFNPDFKPDFTPDDMPEEVKAHFEEMKAHFEEMQANGDFPPFGGPMGFHPADDNGKGFGGEGMMPFGKRKYISPAKGIKSNGKITVNSGVITVTTNTPGAEGMEGKEGVVLNGGDITVTAIDDAINANERIFFNGARVVARSLANDAVDANLDGGWPPFFGGEQGDKKDVSPAIIITGGEVYAWSQTGAPEEGLDCDFSPIEISGGKVFSIGAGMGDMPSVPTNETAKQPTVLLIGLNITEGEPVEIYDSSHNLLSTITAPFSFQRSSSIISCPEFQKGESYTVRTGDYEKTFTIAEPFTVVR